MTSTNHCWGTQFSSNVSVYAFRGQWIAGLETTMSRHLPDQQHQQRGRQLARTSGDHRRHSCPDLLRVPRGSSGGTNTTTPHGLAVGDGAGVVDSVRFSEMVEVSEMTKAAATFLTNGVAVNAGLAKEAERGRSTCCQSRGKDYERGGERCSEACDSSSENDVAETVYVTSGSSSRSSSTSSTSTSSSGGFSSSSSGGTLRVVPSSTKQASRSGNSSQEQQNHETSPSVGNSGRSGAAETYASSSVSPTSSCSSSSSSPSPSSCTSSSSFFGGSAAMSGVDMNDLIEPLEVDQTATSIEPVSPSGETSASSSSEDTDCSQTKTRRAGRGRRPSSLLDEQQQQQQQEQEEEHGVGDFPGRASSGGSGAASGIRMAGCRIVGSGDSIGSSATLVVGAPEPLAPNDRQQQQQQQQQLRSRSDFNQGLWGYWSGNTREDGRCGSRSSDSSVSTASYGDEERSRHYGPSRSNDHGADGDLLLHDPWLSVQGYSPVLPRGQGEEENSSRAASLLVVEAETSAAASQHSVRCPLSDITPQSLSVLKVVDMNIGQPAGTPRVGAASGGGGGDEGSGSKRTPEERAYLRRAGIELFDSNASSVENAFVGTALRLAAMKSAWTKAVAEGDGSPLPPSTVAPGSPAGSIDTAAGSPSASAEHAAAAAAAAPPLSPSPPNDSASFMYSWAGGQDAAAPSSGPFFGVAEVVGAADVHDGVYGDGEADGSSVGTPAEWTGGQEPNEETTGVSRSPVDSGESPWSDAGHAPSCSYNGSSCGSDDAGSSRSLGSGGRAGGGSRRGTSCTYRQEGGVWIDVDGTPMGRIPPPQAGLGGSLHPHHSRTKGLRPVKKSISEAGGLGSYLEGASSTRVSVIAAAEMSRAAVAGALDSLWGCLQAQPSPRVQHQPSLSPSYTFSYMRPEELSVWGGVYSTE